MKKHFRLLSIFLVLILSFSLFSVNAFAVDVGENLVDSELTNWDLVYEPTSYKFYVARFSSLPENFYTVFYKGGQNIPVGSYACLSKVTDLVLGENYKFNFSLYFDDKNIDCFDYYTLSVGFASKDANGDIYFIDDNSFVTFSNETHSFSNGIYDFDLSFVNNSLTDVYLCFYLVCHQSYNTNITDVGIVNTYSYSPVFGNVSLTRQPSETENKLDGILGWLEDIKNSITGLGDNLNTVWENITSSVSSLGDRINGFFTELSNTISTKFNELTTNFSNFITNLGDRISDFFDNLITNVKTFFEELPRKIFNYEIEVTDDDIISDGSGSDGGSSNDNILNLDSGWYGYVGKIGSSNYNCSVTNYDDYIYFEKAKNSYVKFYLNDVPLKANCSAVLTFTVFNLKENLSFYFDCRSDYFFKTLGIIGSSGTYTLELPVVPVDSSFNIEITGNSDLYSELAYFNIKDCYITYVPIEDGSTGDTGSDEEGTTTKVSWFQYLINKFNGWFTGLGNRIINYILYFDDEIPENPFTGVDSPLDHVQGFFDDLIEYLSGISDDIETVLDSITAPVTLLDTFTKRFEWLFGILTFTLMMIVVSRFIGL